MDPIAASTRSNKAMKVFINLSDADRNEPLSDRIIALTAPAYEVTVGRGSQSDATITPGPANAWFSSRVMSRQHATIKADPITQTMTIQDNKSMHGTFIDDARVGPQPLEVFAGDTLKFGAQVVRGEETYQPLKVVINFEWNLDESDACLDNYLANENIFRNKFTVDFTEDELDSDTDGEVKVVQEIVRDSNPEFEFPNLSSVRAVHVHDVDHQAELQDSKSRNSGTNLSLEDIIGASEAEVPVSFESDFDDYSEDAYLEENSDQEQEEQMQEDDIDSEDGEFSDDIDAIDEEASNKMNTAAPYHTSPTVLAVPTDNKREPSPSDAALARTQQPAPVTATSFPSATAASLPASYDTFGMPRAYNVVAGGGSPQFSLPQASTSKPPEPPRAYPGYTDPCSFYQPPTLPIGFTGNMATPTYTNPTFPYSWPSWKSTLTTCGNSGPPQPYGLTRASLNDTVPSTCWSSPSFPTPVKYKRDETTALPVDGLRSKKRKADEVSEYSDDESIDLIPDTLLARDSERHSSSSVQTPSSPISAILTAPLRSEMALKTASKPLEALDDTDKYATSDNHSEVVVDSAQPVLVLSQDDDDEPPRKRIKSNDGTNARRSRVVAALKYTATALAGATVGAIGTVVGLAALPTDYFA